jgi:hypothetical protein
MNVKDKNDEAIVSFSDFANAPKIVLQIPKKTA